MSALLWLDRAGCDDPRRVGGKAASLARLAAEFPVPPGFCLPVDARGDADSISSALREAVAIFDPNVNVTGDGAERAPGPGADAE